MNKIKIACIGSWAGHAIEFSEAVKKMEECQLMAVWDEDPEKGRQWGEMAGVRFEPDVCALMNDPDIDGVIITCGTTKHAKYIIQAANAGKHIFVEKALAASNEDARAIREAVLRSNVHFTMSDPVMRGGLCYLKRLASEGYFGRITSVRMRTLNDMVIANKFLDKAYITEENGGGSFIDIGCHCVHVLSWFLGKPVRARALMHSYTEEGKSNNVDEIAMAIYEFENGAMGVAEAGWVGLKYQFEFNIYGTKGCACAFRRDDNDEILRVSCRPADGVWTEVPMEEVKTNFTYPLNYWVDSILNNTKNEVYGVDEAVRLTEMLMAGYDSNQDNDKIQTFTI